MSLYYKTNSEFNVGSQSLRYVLHGIPICKYYFRICTGFTKNHFNKILFQLFNPMVRQVRIKYNVTAHKVRQPLVILDVLFSSSFIKCDPSVKNLLVHVKSKWLEIYKEDFLPLWSSPSK